MRGCPVPVLDAVWNTRAHIERVAWLAQHGWTDPIYLDVGCPALATPTWWPVQDGNHRLAAAILTGQTAILVAVSGDLTVIDSRLPALALDS
jgi:ParB-like chromosome segregation protein Spo0J